MAKLCYGRKKGSSMYGVTPGGASYRKHGASDPGGKKKMTNKEMNQKNLEEAKNYTQSGVPEFLYTENGKKFDTIYMDEGQLSPIHRVDRRGEYVKALSDGNSNNVPYFKGQKFFLKNPVKKSGGASINLPGIKTWRHKDKETGTVLKHREVFGRETDIVKTKNNEYDKKLKSVKKTNKKGEETKRTGVYRQTKGHTARDVMMDAVMKNSMKRASHKGHTDVIKTKLMHATTSAPGKRYNDLYFADDKN